MDINSSQEVIITECTRCGIEIEAAVPVAPWPGPICPECHEDHEVAQVLDLARERVSVETKITAQVARARAAGATWSSIGRALDVSAQAAQQRYGRTR